MIVYFADRQLNILGQASTDLPAGLTISKDCKGEDVETGVAVFECDVHFSHNTRRKVESFAEVGNFVLRKNGDECELYTIIDSETDTKKQTVYVYAEDAGLDLLNEVVGVYEADKAYPITHYVEKFAYDSGFRIGINEATSLTRKLAWDGEQTVTARLASVATQFDGCEISYSFKIKGLRITDKLINIYKQRGRDVGTTLWLNKDIDNIIIKKSIANIATALRATGGTPDDADDPITLRGYKYDDGDFYIDGDCLKSRKALQKWSRYLNPNEPNLREGHEGHIVQLYSYDTENQATLFAHTLAELKLLCEMEANYEAEIKNLKGAKIGDRINIVDEAGELYLSSRLLQLETSIEKQEIKAVLGEHLIKASGISQKVENLAKQFAINSKSAERALTVAKNANTAATAAQGQANTALVEAGKAQQTATSAATAADTATQSASEAKTAAGNAQKAVDSVEEKVTGLETTVDNAQQAATNAQAAATTAQSKADEAAENAAQALLDAAVANESVTIAQSKAEQATTKAEEAKTTAEQAIADSATAKGTADAAKADAEKAKQDILSLGDQLESVTTTMKADYARKTDLTEATASLQTQISQNAAEISSTASRVVTIDETANNAKELAETAQSVADQAQTKADQATADATAAKTAASNAATAAANAQSEADAAKTAAANAKSIADNAEAELEAAKADLATVSGRVDATEEEIAAAQQAVTAAQEAANKAKQDANTAAEKATTAQQTANTAVSNASAAQQAADGAAALANAAQATANEAKGDAATAQAKANEAAQTAATAQATADTAKTNATDAQARADKAVEDAATAQQAAEDADAKATQAATDFATAQQNLENVTSRVDATEAEVAAAQQAVTTAQAAANKAKEDAEAAQATADTARANAATAQTAANNAKSVADQAQADAEAAQQAADEAQAAVSALAVRVTTAETQITQNSEQIALMATKKEVTETLGGYYTKAQTDSAISVKANEINLSVDSKIDGMQIGGKNLATETTDDWTDILIGAWSGSLYHTVNGVSEFRHEYSAYGVKAGDWLTFGISLKAINKPIAIRIDPCPSMNESGKACYGNYISVGKEGRSIVTIQADADNPVFKVYIGTDGASSESTTEQYKAFKVEKGNKATDWTPAPDDVDSAIENTAENLNQTISQQRTSILADSESITLSILESYVEKNDYEESKEAVQAQFEMQADKIDMNFSATSERIDGIDADLQEEVASRSKHITFTEDGIKITAGSNSMTIRIDNDLIQFERDGKPFGTWDGVNFHTGNIVIDLNQRAQIGPIAFVPRSDGSVSVLKVK